MKIENAIICEDVRKDQGNKHILIGVYPEKILVSDFPARVRLTLWVQFFADEDGPLELGMRVIRKDKSEVLNGLAEINIENHETLITVNFPPVPIELTKIDVLSFQIRKHKKRWKIAKNLEVGLQSKNN